MCVRIIVYNCHTQHSTEHLERKCLIKDSQNSYDNIPGSYRPDSHHSSDNVYWKVGSKALRGCTAKYWLHV